jgi:Arabinogalactan endo-1,4-beta-galactosidase
MKRIACAAAAALLAMALSAESVAFRPVQDISKDFIMGADISMLDKLESVGASFSDESGKKGDCLAILKSGGVNWIRLRIWNDPVTHADVVEGGKAFSKAGDPVGGGDCDLASYIRVAKRAKKLGLKVLADFHYSDFWADPSKQSAPYAWKDLALPELRKALYDYTDKSLKAMKAAGAMPDMVQIGNEVDNGFIWPVGKVFKSSEKEVIGGEEAFVALLKEASAAVRANDPNKANAKKKIKVMIHVANGGDNAHFRQVFDPIAQAKVDFDVIGLSFYPYWHGKVGDLAGNMADLAQAYGKEMIVAEIAYPYTLDNYDETPNSFGPGLEKQGGYKASVQGQTSALCDIIAAAAGAPDGKGIGVFYWEPDWIAVAGAGWRTGDGNSWENQALFDAKGVALPSLKAFKRVREAGEVPDLRVLSVEEAKLKIPEGGVLALPDTLLALYSDDSYRSAQVQWQKPDPESLKTVGTITVKGKVWGYKDEVVATVDVVRDANLIADSSFESGKLAAAWKLEGPGIEAAKVEKNPGNAHSGDWSFKYWLDKPFAFTLTRSFSGLKDGTYALRAWAMGGGGEKAYSLFAKNYGGPDLSASIVNTGWQKWKLYEIADIKVVGGACDVGLSMDGDSGNWGNADDFEFVRTGD